MISSLQARKGNKTEVFYTMPQYESWKEAHGADGWKVTNLHDEKLVGALSACASGLNDSCPSASPAHFADLLFGTQTLEGTMYDCCRPSTTKGWAPPTRTRRASTSPRST